MKTVIKRNIAQNLNYGVVFQIFRILEICFICFRLGLKGLIGRNSESEYIHNNVSITSYDIVIIQPMCIGRLVCAHGHRYDCTIVTHSTVIVTIYTTLPHSKTIISKFRYYVKNYTVEILEYFCENNATFL